MSTISTREELTTVETTLNNTKLVAFWKDKEFINFRISSLEKDGLLDVELFSTKDRNKMNEIVFAILEFQSEVKRRNL